MNIVKVVACRFYAQQRDITAFAKVSLNSFVAMQQCAGLVGATLPIMQGHAQLRELRIDAEPWRTACFAEELEKNNDNKNGNNNNKITMLIIIK